MSDRDDTDTTLPTVDAIVPDRPAAPELILTVIFHPDSSRIGEFAILRRDRSRHIIGRRSPGFDRITRAGQQERTPLGLNDPHVSRQVMELWVHTESLLVRRSRDGCRCRIDGEELEGEKTLTASQLQRGVPMLIAHSVVLLLRLMTPPSRSVHTFNDRFIGSSACMQQLREHIALAANSDLDVLVTGETGTGKELVARAIHEGSRRQRGPLVSVNVAAVPAGLAAASLFGAERGAFTGADRPRTGYFQQAAGGTLFLDEIGDAPDELQPQLLRALQEREIQVVGGHVKSVDLRVVSATDAAIEGERCGFKTALRHRLGAIEIVLQPLRAHPEDVGELLRHYLQQAFTETGRAYLLPQPESEPGIVAVWASLFHAALRCRWPGNVRQLRNMCTQVAVASQQRLAVPPSVSRMLSDVFDNPEPAEDFPRPITPAETGYRRISDVADEEFDRAMEACFFEAKGAAGRLGVSRQSIYRRIETTEGYRLASQVPEPELQEAVADCRGDVRAAAMRLRVSASGIRARLRRTGQQ